MGIYTAYLGIMERIMKTAIQGLGFRFGAEHAGFAV